LLTRQFDPRCAFSKASDGLDMVEPCGDFGIQACKLVFETPLTGVAKPKVPEPL
jgi:hypothetical protein